MLRLQVVYPEDSQIAKELRFLHTKNQGSEFTEKTCQKTEMLRLRRVMVKKSVIGIAFRKTIL